MLKKRNLSEIYIKLASLHSVFTTISDKNKELEKAYYRENPSLINQQELALKEVIDSSKKSLSSTERYILFHVEDTGMRGLIVNLYAEMNFYDFKGVSSVPNHIHIKHLTDRYTRYDIFNDITLYQHTLNCAVCAVEVCKQQDVPEKIRETIILLSILHDFGKSPLVVEKLAKENVDLKNAKIMHNIHSAAYAESFLKNYIGEAIQEETYKKIIETLKNHHNEYAEESLWLTLLKESDFLARDKEEKFGTSKVVSIDPNTGEVL